MNNKSKIKELWGKMPAMKELPSDCRNPTKAEMNEIFNMEEPTWEREDGFKFKREKIKEDTNDPVK